MGRSQFQAFLLISLLLLSLFPSQGYGRRIKVMRRHRYMGKKTWAGREMVEVVNDYQEPEANTNPRSGSPFTPHPPSRP